MKQLFSKVSKRRLKMPALSEYLNVHNTVFNILVSKGYNIWFNEEMDVYCAEKNGWDFMADTPCGLLGLIAIYEYKEPTHYHEYWWKEEQQDLVRYLSKTTPG
ncbi:hypothetical protein, partial [Escherichia coli]|uniref:hypothetical protein n=1 Tax=Escherichia coli TaxID=562 RepID=UPI001923C59E